MAEEALQQEEELTEVELPETEEDQEEEVVEDDQPQEESKPEEDKKESDEIEDYSEGVKKRIAKLTYKIREAERREQAAVDYAKSVQDELNKTKNKLSKTDQNLYDEYKGRVGSELQYAQDRYKKAYESGDTDANLLVCDAGTNAVKIAGATTSKVGFYGTTPTAQQATIPAVTPMLSPGASPDDNLIAGTVDQIISALQTLGLIA